ncbi:hypothetical protein HPB48_021306 [Haemaphysalis longicornis]|uniref:Transposable element n=1 Tax=Haemaphysalis longicornis TaxID=44386 RepID=A0A9J6FAB7_HAELO|nr:hypothetical protein HPB48_021306 [Haemaphysalis longicornis]
MDDPKVHFLYKVLDWLDEWKARTNSYDSGKLTAETHGALHQTTSGLIEVARYCFNELNVSYVLLGKIQSDGLEDRFGKYSQLAGGQYHVSIRQVYECENKLRLQSTLPSASRSSGSIVDKDEKWDGLDKDTGRPVPLCNVVVTEETLQKIRDVIPVLVYVAGYAVYATLKKLKCEKCRALLTLNKEIRVSVNEKHYELVREMDRGGLVHPTMFAVNAVTYNYAVVEQLSKMQEQFLSMPNQRQVATDLTAVLLADEECSDFDACDDGRTSELLLKHVLWCSTNILLKNFCCRLNDKIADASAKTKERKLQTLSK